MSNEFCYLMYQIVPCSVLNILVGIWYCVATAHVDRWRNDDPRLQLLSRLISPKPFPWRLFDWSWLVTLVEGHGTTIYMVVIKVLQKKMNVNKINDDALSIWVWQSSSVKGMCQFKNAPFRSRNSVRFEVGSRNLDVVLCETNTSTRYTKWTLSLLSCIRSDQIQKIKSNISWKSRKHESYT